MALKAVLDTLDGVSESLAAEYTKGDDGKFRLNVEGGEDLTVIKGALQKERDARKALEKAQSDGSNETAELRKRLQDAEDARLHAEGKGAEVAEKQVERMKADFEKRLKDSEEKLALYEAKINKREGRVFESEIQKVVEKAGLLPTARVDVVYRAKDKFRLDENDNLVALDGEFGKDGKSVLSVQEWLEGARDDAPHWFPAKSGSGTGGGGGGSMKRSDMSAQQMNDFINRNGQEAYLNLPI